MSTSNIPDIAVMMSHADDRPQAQINFNKLRSSQTVHWVQNGGDSGFLEGIERCIKSTFEQASPLPGKSSAGLARFTPSTIVVHNHSEYPVAAALFQNVRSLAGRIMKEWRELIPNTNSEHENPS